MKEGEFSKEKLVDRVVNLGMEKIELFNHSVPFPEVPFFAMMEFYNSQLAPLLNHLQILGSEYLA